MEIGKSVKVKLASGEWYFGKVSAIVPYFHGSTRFEVRGAKPRPFVTITSAESLKAV